MFYKENLRSKVHLLIIQSFQPHLLLISDWTFLMLDSAQIENFFQRSRINVCVEKPAVSVLSCCHVLLKIVFTRTHYRQPYRRHPDGLMFNTLCATVLGHFIDRALVLLPANSSKVLNNIFIM